MRTLSMDKAGNNNNSSNNRLVSENKLKNSNTRRVQFEVNTEHQMMRRESQW